MGGRNTPLAGLRKNGTEFPAEAAISRLEVSGRTLLTVALRDITERKRVEVERESSSLEAGAVLASSLRYTETLKSIARLVVRRAAGSWCLVDIIEEGAERVERVSCRSSRRQPGKASACERLEALSLWDRSSYSRADGPRSEGATAVRAGRSGFFDGDGSERRAPPVARGDRAEVGHHQRHWSRRAACWERSFSGSSTPGRVRSARSRFRRASSRATPRSRSRIRGSISKRRGTQPGRATTCLSIVAHDIRNPLSSIPACCDASRGISSRQRAPPAASRALRLIGSARSRAQTASFRICSIPLASTPERFRCRSALSPQIRSSRTPVAAQRLLAIARRPSS